MVVGEIGIDPELFKYKLLWWEIRSIIRGYDRRRRDLWSSIRWQTFELMRVSMADLTKAGIHNPTDLLPLPWDKKEPVATLSEEEMKELQADMDSFSM